MDSETFKRTIIPLQSPMQLLAERILGNAADAEDIVQDVFIILWKKHDELDKVVNISSYCMQSIRTRCIDHLRQRNRDASHIKTIQGITDSEIFMEIEEQNDMDQTLHTLMEELPETQRKAIQMKYLENCSTAQMEEALQMSSSNVYTTLSRALQNMRERLNHITI